MSDEIRTKKELIKELQQLRGQITSLKTSEHDLNLEVEKLSKVNKIINHSPAVAFLWKNEEGWPVEFVSDNVEKLTGHSSNEFLNRKLSYIEIIHSDDVERVVKEKLNNSKKEEVQAFSHEPYRIITKSGDTKWIDDITYIHRDHLGTITHYEGIIYNITEYKQSEESVLIIKDRLSTFINSAIDAFAIYDSDLNLVICNETMMKLYNPLFKNEDLIGKNILELLPRLRSTKRYARLQDAIKTGKTFSDEDAISYNSEASVPESEHRYISIKGFKVDDGLGVITRDITERKQTEVRIIHLNSVLRALREINRLITREQDREQFINQSCDLMVEMRGYLCAWILLFDERMKYISSALSGGRETQAFSKSLKKGIYPPCIDEIMKRKNSFAVHDNIANCKLDCIPKNFQTKGSGFISRLEYGGKVYGIISTYVQLDFVVDLEEQSLFKEIADDISFALYNFEKREERKQWEGKIEGLARFPDEDPNPVLRVAYDGLVIYANRSSQSLLKHWKVKVGEYIKDPLSKLIKQIITDNRVLQTEVTLNEKVLLCYLTPILSAGYINIYCTDITELKQVENELREEQRRLKEAQALGRIGSWEYDIESQKIVWADETYVLYERNPDLGPPTAEEEERYYSIKQAKVLRDYSARSIKNKEDFRYDVEVNLPSGKKGFFTSAMRPIMNESGRVIKLFGIVQDITEQKKAEEELKLRAEMLNQASDGIMLRDFNGNLLYANETATRERGYTLEEFFKLNAKDLVVAETGSRDVGEWFQEVREKGYRHNEFNVRHKDGYLVPMDAMATKIKSGGKEYLLSVTRNITEQKRMEAERKEMECKAQVASRLASVGEMASGIAHEINNPLTGVVGFAQLLAERKDLPEDVREQLKIIHEGGQRVSNIIKGLLSFARQSKPKREYIDINDVVEGTLRLSHYELETGNIEVIKQFDPELPWTMADAGQLQQVFINLVVNAQQEMRKAHGKGRLEIKTELADDMIHISFKDDGPGIAKENIERIFDPFFTTKESGKGTGLGLSLSHGIIAEHGGQLYVESDQGKGAAFVVELPVLGEEGEVEEVEVGDATKELVKGRILVVDDEEVVRQYLNSILTKMGHIVEMAADGKEASELVKSTSYNLILSDIKMPGMDGKEFYRKVGEIAPSLTGRLVFITGDVMGEDTRDFIRKTGALYLTKPFDAGRLREVVNNILSGSI